MAKRKTTTRKTAKQSTAESRARSSAGKNVSLDAAKKPTKKSPRKSATSKAEAGRKAAGPAGVKTARKKPSAKRHGSETKPEAVQPESSVEKPARKQASRSGKRAEAVSETRRRAKKSTATRKSSGRGAASSRRSASGNAERPSDSSTRSTGRNGDTIHHSEPAVDPAEICTHLKDSELNEFRQMLLAKRRELAGDVNHLESEAMHHNDNVTGNSSAMPLHMADLGSDTWEQELTLGLIANERSLLREIDEALDRIENKTYGVCLATGKPITKARLHVKPWAKYCIEYARKRELGLV